MATVLVVDDERAIRQSVRGILTDEGLTVLEAENGRGALELVRDRNPDLVLLDIWMPEIDGMEVLRELRRAADGPEVVMISGHGNIETAVMATKLGAFDFVEKPFSLDGLLRIVNRALAHHASGQRRSDPAWAETTARIEVGATRSQSGSLRQRTLARSVVATGHGLHSGGKSGLLLQPLPPGSGIQFTNLSAHGTVPAHIDFVHSTGYATALRGNGIVVKTVEHLLATLHAYGITNCLIKVEGEVPIMDGSALEFCRLVESAGLQEQDANAEEIVIRSRLAVGDAEGDGEMIAIEPCDELRVDYTLRYPAPVGEQRYDYTHAGPESFRDQIAPARTFGFVRDMKAMSAMGLASGGRLDNCILVGEEGIVNTTLRFADEFARHKILDVMGDLYLLGRPIRGAVRARFTGHAENIALLDEIRQAHPA